MWSWNYLNVWLFDKHFVITQSIYYLYNYFVIVIFIVIMFWHYVNIEHAVTNFYFFNL